MNITKTNKFTQIRSGQFYFKFNSIQYFLFPEIKLHILTYNINSKKNYSHIISKNYSVTKNVLKPVSVDSRDIDWRISKIVPRVLFLK